MAKRENDLGRDPIGKLLLRLAVPTVTAQLVNALYNIVDRIYIGHIPVRAISPSPAWASASP
jgi:Na+-driven multidrug efflux pump